MIGRVAQATDDDVAEAAARARAAQPAGKVGRRTVPGFSSIHDILLDHLDEITDLIQLEGEISDGRLEEVVDVIGVTEYIANVTPRATRRRRHQGAMPVFTKTYEYRHPRGLVGFISPWNYPFILSISGAVAALATGSAVLIKPDEDALFGPVGSESPRGGRGAGRCAADPDRGRCPDREAIVDSVDYVMFTGSTEVGRSIAEMAGASSSAAQWSWAGRTQPLSSPMRT